MSINKGLPLKSPLLRKLRKKIMNPTENKIIDDLKNRKENLSLFSDNPFERYKYLFVTEPSGHIKKSLSGEWKTEFYPPYDWLIHGHLYQKFWCGGRYQKLTRYVALDFDDKPLDYVYEYCSIIKATTANSRLYTSPSGNSYHLFLLLSRNGLIPIPYVQKAFKSYTDKRLFEVYPQTKQGFRFPFGKDQNPVYDCCRNLISWEDKVDDFWNLNIFDLNNLPYYDLQNLDLFLDIPESQQSSHVTPVKIELSHETKPHRHTFRFSDKKVQNLIKNGLTPGLRDRAQYILFVDQYQKEVPLNDAIRFVSEFIRDNHKGNSKDYLRNPEKVFTHISGQGKRIYDHFEKLGILPADIHCSEREFLSYAYICFALDHCDHKLPVAKHLTKNIAYYSSRKHRELVRIPCKKLKEWSDKNYYLKHINTFETHGAGKRGSDYRPDHYSKYLMLNLPESNPDEAIYFDGRLARTLDEAIRGSCTPAEARKLLRDKGFPRKNAEKIVQRMYKRRASTRKRRQKRYT